MTEDEKKIAEAIRKSVDVRLPEGFADRFVQHIREGKKETREQGVLGEGLVRVVLLAASVTLLLGFVPLVFDHPDAGRDVRVVQHDVIRPVDANRTPPDFQLNGLALFGFCHEAIRRRVRALWVRGRKREDER